MLVAEKVTAPHKYSDQAVPFSNAGKFGVRVTALFVLLLCIPVSSKFYTGLIMIDWTQFNWQTLSGIASGFGAPDFIDIHEADIWDAYSYINIFVSFIVAFSTGLIWYWKDIPKINDHFLYYITRTVARYRLAFGVIAWGYKKFIPIQMELPTATFLETPFIDFSEQKLYWQSVGIVQGYEIFLGGAEVMAGLLLLFRRTAALGAALTVALMVNIVIANHAYEGMVHVHSFTYALIGGIILWFELPAILKLLLKEQDVSPMVHPETLDHWKILRPALKYLSISVFVFYLLYLHWKDDLGYRFPHNYPGLKGVQGVYDVTVFSINNKVVPYSPLDTLRWQDAIFEKWSTLAIKVNRLQQMDLDNTGREGKKSIDKRFEFRGIGGGRHYFDYTVDTLHHMLVLQNKNKSHRDQKLVLHYFQPSVNRIVLSGINEHKDSLKIILDKQEKEYLLYQGRKLQK